MGFCSDCIYYTQSGTSAFDDIRNTFRINGDKIGYCRLLTDRYGRATQVEGFGSCDHFTERPTRENGGYRGSGTGSLLSGCFLTSACVDYLGKPDDCKELTVLRKFRDEYMKSTEKGKKLVDEYYAVAPRIVEKIDASDRRDDYYKYIYGIITECIDLINQSKNESALDEYCAMVRRLSDELLNK